MHIFALGDLHLSMSADKPMDIFGEVWSRHTEKIQHNWENCIGNDDWVLIPGDISWAMQLEAAAPDLRFLAALPGKKLLLRGNHDYWWSSRSKVEALLDPDMHLLQNDCRVIGDIAVCGTRGWVCPGSSGFSAADEKVYARELQRLALSLKSAPPDKEKLVMLHFPPFCERSRSSGFTALAEEYNVQTLVYAHLHGSAHKGAFEGLQNGVRYVFAAGDHLNFMPTRLY